MNIITNQRHINLTIELYRFFIFTIFWSRSIASADQPGGADDAAATLPGSVDGIEPYVLHAPPLPLAEFILVFHTALFLL